MNRRKLLQLAPVGLLPSCCLVSPPNCEGLSQLPNAGSMNQPLIIDTHAHTFNATDLQVKEFLTRVALNNVSGSPLRNLGEMFAGVVERVGWGLAPTAVEELQVLSECLGKSTLSAEDISVRRQSKYQLAKAQIEGASRAQLQSLGQMQVLSRSFAQLDSKMLPLALATEMPDRYEDLYANRWQADTFAQTGRLSILGALRFFVEMFQYRHVSALNYFDTYKRVNADVDLLVSSSVDYDWWLAQGRSTPSSLQDQMSVNGLIAQVSGGRVHAFVPFDPLRQVLWNLGLGAGDSPLAMVKEATVSHGAMGVKLYPPMGFAMANNKRFLNHSAQIWGDKGWLPDIARKADFAVKLDDALNELYDYCAREGVSVLAHSSRSNMADTDYERLLFSDSWSEAFKTPKLKASFGHFSGLGSGKPMEHWADFIEELLQDRDHSAKRRYADISYFSSFRQRPDEIVSRLRQVLFDENGEATGAAQQLVYGSDWKMLLMENNAENYLDAIMSILADADSSIRALGQQSSLQTAVLGLNAADFLGLRRGQQTRKRLDDFYEVKNIAPPRWMHKVDAASMQGAWAPEYSNHSV